MKGLFAKTGFTFLLAFCFFTCANAQIGSHQTTFNPATDGLKFVNTFDVEPINNIRMSGFCGGMVYTALDYFKAHKPVPVQTYRPANGTPLFDYIWGRQRSSVLDNADKWGELTFNPFGWRTSEFFNWGLQGTNGGRLDELKREIDRGNPVPLGLFKPGNGGMGPHHQVLAIGYNGGRYRGDLGDFKEDLEIMVYDPNFPGQTKILKAQPDKFIYYYKGDVNNVDCQWQTYFVNKKYNFSMPPLATDPVKKVPGTTGKVSEILLEIRTGGDDLRGGNDNVSVTVRIAGRPDQQFSNINKGARWIDNYTETVPLHLAVPVNKEDIQSILFATSFGGGIGGDNWNMDAVRVLVNGGEVLAQKNGTPLNRFTGDRKLYTLAIH